MENLTEEQIEEMEKQLLDRAKEWWNSYDPLTKATDLEKLRIYNREGLVVGKFEHDIKKGWYKKQGYWEDGSTTLDEKEREYQLKKIEHGKKISRLQDSYIGNLDEIVENIKAKKKQIEQIPQVIKKEYGIKRDELVNKFKEELNDLNVSYKKNIEEETEKIYTGMITDFEIHKSELLLKMKNELETMLYNSKRQIENEINTLGAELEAELSILDASKHDDDLLKELHAEIKLINQRINKLRGIDGEIQEPQVELKLDIKEEPQETFICPYCTEEERRPFGNKGGLGGHILHKHPEKYEEYKNPQKQEQEVPNI